MIPYERHEAILNILNNKEIIKIEDLHKSLPEISISTLRRDLKELEKKGSVVMLTGGGVKIISTSIELPVSTKRTLYSLEKDYIAALASTRINDGDTIYLDSGTTCSALLNKIINKKITIITSNTSVFSINKKINATIILLGGTFNPEISSLNGPLTDNNINNFYFDKSFLGANGVDPQKGITTPNLTEANKKKHILKNSTESFLLCDNSKFYNHSAVKSLDINDVIIISNKNDNKIAKLTTLIYE